MHKQVSASHKQVSALSAIITQAPLLYVVKAKTQSIYVNRVSSEFLNVQFAKAF
jgi:hypothetical protein